MFAFFDSRHYVVPAFSFALYLYFNILYLFLFHAYKLAFISEIRALRPGVLFKIILMPFYALFFIFRRLFKLVNKCRNENAFFHDHLPSLQVFAQFPHRILVVLILFFQHGIPFVKLFCYFFITARLFRVIRIVPSYDVRKLMEYPG